MTPTGTVAPRVTSRQRDPRMGLVALAVLAGVLFAIVAIALAISKPLDHVDAAASIVVRSVAPGSKLVLHLSEGFTFLGSTLFVTAVCTVVTIWLLIKRRLDAVVYLLCTVPLGWYISTLLKSAIGRQRPQGVNLVPLPTDRSFPSGHTVAAALMCGALAVIVILNVKSPAAKKWVIAIGLAIPVLVAFSRVYLGVHWFGDVVGAWLYALAWWGFTTSVYLGVLARRQDVPV